MRRDKGGARGANPVSRLLFTAPNSVPSLGITAVPPLIKDKLTVGCAARRREKIAGFGSRGVIRQTWLWAAVLTSLLPSSIAFCEAAERVSTLGRYQRHSQEVFDGWQRTSQHVTVRDGTRIAVDTGWPVKMTGFIVTSTDERGCRFRRVADLKRSAE